MSTSMPIGAADLNKEIAMKIYHVVSVYKDALVDGTNNSDQHKFAVGKSDEQKFDSMGSPKLEHIKKHGSERQADAKAKDKWERKGCAK